MPTIDNGHDDDGAKGKEEEFDNVRDDDRNKSPEALSPKGNRARLTARKGAATPLEED